MKLLLNNFKKNILNKLTIDSFISFLRKYNKDNSITEESDIVSLFGNGEDIYYLLGSIEEEFNVTLENFDFLKYFDHEEDFSLTKTISYIITSFFKPNTIKKKEICTPTILYEYMIKNKKLLD